MNGAETLLHKEDDKNGPSRNVTVEVFQLRMTREATPVSFDARALGITSPAPMSKRGYAVVVNDENGPGTPQLYFEGTLSNAIAKTLKKMTEGGLKEPTVTNYSSAPARISSLPHIPNMQYAIIDENTLAQLNPLKALKETKEQATKVMDGDGEPQS